MTPNESAEIPQEFLDWAKREAELAFPKGKSGHYRYIFGHEGFEKAAEAVYRHLSGQFPRWVKAIEKEPEMGGDIIWRYVGAPGTARVGFKPALGFWLGRTEYEADYTRIEYLLEPPSVEKEGDQ